MPLLFDMSWENLQTYEGRNPKPADFDSFWDNGLLEIAAIDPETELIPSAFQTSFAECLDMYFTGAQGARIHAKLIRPKDVQEPHPAVLLFTATPAVPATGATSSASPPLVSRLPRSTVGARQDSRRTRER